MGRCGRRARGRTAHSAPRPAARRERKPPRIAPIQCFSWLSPPYLGEASTGGSMRERPEPQLFLADRPKPREPVRLDDEKEDDERAESHEFEMRDHRRRQRDAECGRDLVEKDRHHRDEGRAEETAEYRTEPADDDHEKQRKGAVDRKGERLPGPEVHEGPERT